MHEIDLVPESFRSWHRFTQQARVAGGLLLVAVVAVVVAYVLLQQQVQSVQDRVEQLQQQKLISGQQRTQLESLVDRREALQKQMTLLTGLRGGASVRVMFQTIDRAVDGAKVWFTNWQYRRAGSVVTGEVKAENTGYFLIITGGENAAEREAWQIETHMTITGEAMDHSTLSEFVIRLIEQPQIADVRVLNTSRKERDNMQLVDFDLAVTVENNEVFP